jgi:hypothetical protein
VKIDTDSPGYFSMSEFPDEVVVSVRKRTEWELELGVTRSETGQEGAWYVDPEEMGHVRLEPFSEEGEGEKGNWRFLLFRLRPSDKQGPGIQEHRFLLRSWNSDVYVPRMESAVLILKRHETRGGDVTWELKTPKATLYGIRIDGPSVQRSEDG